MTRGTKLALRAIPTPTPQHARSLSPQQLEEHRARIVFDVEVVLNGYWDSQPPEHIKAAILADWADTLEDWTQEQVLYALRKWRDENPNKKPNPGHIANLLRSLRGKKEAERMKVEPVPEKPRERVTAERAREIRDEVNRAADAMRMDKK